MPILLSINAYFYTILGGFFIIAGIWNLIMGEYVPDSIGFIIGIPGVLLGASAFFSIPSIRLSVKKLSRSLWPFFLLCLWFFLTAIVRGTSRNTVTPELAIYFAFWSFAPYCFGLLASRFVDRISEKLIVPIFLSFLLFSVFSLRFFWENLLFGRHRLSGFSRIAVNTYAIIYGGYAMTIFDGLRRSKWHSFIKSLLSIGILVSAVLVAIFSGSMGGIISLYLAAIIFFLFSHFRTFAHSSLFKRAWIITLVIVTFLIPVFIFIGTSDVNLPYGFGTENIAKYFERLQRLRAGQYHEIEAIRLYYMNTFLSAFIENPLFGAGFGSRSGLRSDPHNSFIELLGEAGLPALMLFLVIVWYPLKRSLAIFRDLSRSRVELLLAFMMVAVFIESFFSGSIFINPQLWFLCGIIPVTSGRVAERANQLN